MEANAHRIELTKEFAASEIKLEELLLKPTTDEWKRDEIRTILVSLQISAYSRFIPVSRYKQDDILQVNDLLFKGIATKSKKLGMMKSTHKRVLDFIREHQDVMDKYSVFENNYVI